MTAATARLTLTQPARDQVRRAIAARSIAQPMLSVYWWQPPGPGPQDPQGPGWQLRLAARHLEPNDRQGGIDIWFARDGREALAELVIDHDGESYAIRERFADGRSAAAPWSWSAMPMSHDEVWRLKGRWHAKYHVQVEVLDVRPAPPARGYVTVTARIARLFRGDERIAARQEISILLSPDGAELAPGSVMEAYLGTWPSEFSVSRSQAMIIPAVSEAPWMPVPAEGELDERDAARPGAVDLDIL